MLACVLAQAATGPADAGPDPVRRATAMFVLVVIALAVFFMAVAALIVARRLQRRQAAGGHRPSGVLVDPWSEAARRVQPFDSQDRG